MNTNRIGLKNEWVCVQITVLFYNPLYYYGDVVNESDHHHL